jgi:hypothetical protein
MQAFAFLCVYKRFVYLGGFSDYFFFGRWNEEENEQGRPMQERKW